MNILKYLTVLSLFCLLATAIFIFTLTGEFRVERTKIINSPKKIVFEYIDDYNNWNNFCSWIKNNKNIKTEVDINNKYIIWQGDFLYGDAETSAAKTQTNLNQRLSFNGADTEVFWSFKDTLGGTKVVCKTKGRLNFYQKISTYFKGGSDFVVGEILDNSLHNLDRAIDHKLTTTKPNQPNIQ